MPIGDKARLDALEKQVRDLTDNATRTLTTQLKQYSDLYNEVSSLRSQLAYARGQIEALLSRTYQK